MPELQDPDIDWDGYYTDYEAAYLERDVRDLISVKDEAKFYNFMVACAERTGHLLNTSDIANVIDVDHKTVSAWLSILQASNIIRIVEPFCPNIGKSFAKTPKVFFMDTGLVRADAVKNFKCLEGMQDYEVGFGQVICQTNEPYMVARNVQAVPVWAI